LTRRPTARADGGRGFQPNGANAKTGLNRSILDAGWGILASMLAYKAEDAGRQLIKVNPRHTSQRCASCGHTDRANRFGTAFRCLACGHQADADINAAINILRAGLAQRAQTREVHNVA
jgi:putative transposase